MSDTELVDGIKYYIMHNKSGLFDGLERADQQEIFNSQLTSHRNCYNAEGYNDVQRRRLAFLEKYYPLEWLDAIRRGSLDEFRRNGVESDLEATTVPYSNVYVTPYLAQGFTSYEQKYHTYAKTSQQCNKITSNECVFCKNNGEPAITFSSHVLKDPLGRVLCPVLRRYTCPICGATGESAHTIRYCNKRNTRQQTTFQEQVANSSKSSVASNGTKTRQDEVVSSSNSPVPSKNKGTKQRRKLF